MESSRLRCSEAGFKKTRSFPTLLPEISLRSAKNRLHSEPKLRSACGFIPPYVSPVFPLGILLKPGRLGYTICIEEYFRTRSADHLWFDDEEDYIIISQHIVGLPLFSD